MSGNLGFKKKTQNILEQIEKSKGLEIKKCPKCGSDAYCDQTVIAGGLIVEKVVKGNIVHSKGAHKKCTKWKCDNCGYAFR